MIKSIFFSYKLDEFIFAANGLDAKDKLVDEFDMMDLPKALQSTFKVK